MATTQERSLILLVALTVTLGTFTGMAKRTDCAGAAGNLLAKANCGFDTNAAGWNGHPDTTIAHQPATGGDPATAAMKVTSGAQGSVSASSACVPVKGTTTYQFSARLRRSSGTLYFCAMNVWQYSDMKCAAGQEPLGSDGRPPAETWATVQGTAETRANARSALIRADCSGQGVISILWDDFVLRLR